MNSRKNSKPSKGEARFGADALLAVGNAGTAFCLSVPPEGFPVDGTPTVASFRGFKASGISAVEVGTLHGAGEACGMAEWDAALFVSHRGTPVRVMPLNAALKSGLVHAEKMLLRKDGTEREITVYLAKGQTAGMRQPKFVASPDCVAGRVESKLVSEPGGGPSRNASYVGHLVPLAFAKGTKPTVTPPAPAKGASVKPSAKGAKPTPAAPVKPA